VILAVPVMDAIEMLRFDLVPVVARLKALRSIGYSCPAAMLITRSVVQPEALDAVNTVTDAAGTFGNTVVTVPAVVEAAVVQLRAIVATHATEQYTVAPTGGSAPFTATGNVTVTALAAGCCRVAAVAAAESETLPVVAM